MERVKEILPCKLSSDTIDQVMAYHREAIAHYRMECELKIKPHLDALVSMESRKPIEPLILTREQAEKLGFHN